MPHEKAYVVNSAQRNWKTLSFALFAVTFLKRLCLRSKTAFYTAGNHLVAEDGPWSLFTDTYNAMHQALAPGPSLDELVASVVQHISGSLDGLLETRDEVVIDLYVWIHETTTLASTNAVYRCQNPFKDSEIRSDFW